MYRWVIYFIQNTCMFKTLRSKRNSTLSVHIFVVNLSLCNTGRKLNFKTCIKTYTRRPHTVSPVYIYIYIYIYIYVCNTLSTFGQHLLPRYTGIAIKYYFISVVVIRVKKWAWLAGVSWCCLLSSKIRVSGLQVSILC